MLKVKMIAAILVTATGLTLSLACQAGQSNDAGNLTDSFPGAEGFGRHALGGRGGRVIKVSTLNDDGPGSLRAALREKGPRTVLFDVSGVIELERGIVLTNGRVTIAGQSAPGDGITLKNFGLIVKADDVVIRYIRARPGSEAGVETDAISVMAGENIIIDHCSTSWATDETLTVSPSEKYGLRSIHNVTVQWSMITESLNESVHSKGKHGYGSLVRGSAGARYSFHHNLWAHHQARMPRPGNYVDAETDPEGPLFDFRNNVFYNWGGSTSGYNADTESISRYNFVNNWYQSGTDSGKPLAFEESNSLANSHFSGNFMNGELPGNPWDLVRFKDGRESGNMEPFGSTNTKTQAADEAYEDVLKYAGASLARDSVDERVIATIRAGEGKLIDSVTEVGGWPSHVSLPPKTDLDGDGMPDEWERERNLNPQDPADGKADADGNGYTNLEEYLNGLVEPKTVGNYRVFETSVLNDRDYENRFTDVELMAEYISPSGRTWNFPGFFDGDGKGGGDMSTGNVWKLRFMPDEVGTWSYTWRWNDGSAGGEGFFESTPENAGPGIIRAYRDNPRWFAYNGTEPVWLKSYYVTGHGSIAQDFDWISDHVYQPLIDHGYNHLQVNWLMSLCCYGQYYLDGPEPETLDLDLYKNGEASSTMNLNTWRLMERRLTWLNDHDVGVHMFLGFDGSRNDGPRWEDLDEKDKEFYVRYSVARLGPFANIAGWNFVWEVEGNRETHELGLARLLARYDIFDHLRTYEDEFPREHHYDEDVYTFAAVENHGIVAPSKTIERYNYWRTPWTHYMAGLLAYAEKPVYMSEGNALWRRYWQQRTGTTQDELRQSAWATVMAGASFNWNGHESEYALYAEGPTGLPFDEQNEYHRSENQVEILARVMNDEVEFHKLTPQGDQLTAHDPFRVFALAEEGRQYLVFTIRGEPFSLFLGEGDYAYNAWIDAKTGQKREAPPVSGQGTIEIHAKGGGNRKEWPQSIRFEPPDTDTDWVLVLRKQPEAP